MRAEASPNKYGQLHQTDFFSNIGGLNLSDSVFRISDSQAAGGQNFDYILTGGIRKRLGRTLVNSSPDTQLYSLGLGLYNTAAGTKSVIRAAGTKIQLVDTSVPSFTNLTTDAAAAASDVLTSGSTQTVNFAQFNNGTANILWAFGGGLTIPYGVTSTTKMTRLGVDAPTGVVTKNVTTPGTGTFTATGTMYYAVAYRKASTQALSNAALDVSATTSNTTDNVVLTLTGLTGLDTTLIDKIYIYRSSIGGASAFTTGDLVGQVNSTATSFTDTGTYISTAQNIPRAGSTLLDNSPLPAATYNVGTVFKRRFVTASGSTLYFSDLNKSESFPTSNVIVVPSGGNITGLAVISFTSPQAQTLDELLVVFKEREIWVVTGTSISDWALKFIDQVGCPEQGLAVLANGFLAWVDFRGIYLWDGTSKPIYCSRLIEPLFARDGDLDKSKFSIGTAEFLRRENQLIWYLSSKTFGENKYAIKMDLRLTLPQIEQQLTGRNLDAVLLTDSLTQPVYAALSYIPSGGAQEVLLLGDSSGYVYTASDSWSDAGSSFSFKYLTRALDMGDPNIHKQFQKVIVWVQAVGTWNLLLDYWSDFRRGSNYQATQALPISGATQDFTALWDIAFWDRALWDDYTPQVIPLIFNLEPGMTNNNIGTALQLQFRNDTMNQPISIHGFSVIWNELGGVTA